MKNKRNKIVVAMAALAALFMLSCGAAASEYTLSNGFYWSGGLAYTHEWVRCHDAKCGAYWKSNYIRAPYADAAKNITYQTPGWRERLVELLKQRDAYVQARATAAAEQESFQKAIESLGLASGGVGSYSSSAAYGAYQQQGTSLYGVSASIASTPIDINETMHHALRLRGDSAKYQADGDAKLLSVIDKLNQMVVGADAVAAEIEARTTGAAKILAATAPAARSVTLERQTGDSIVEATEVGGIVARSCVKCHSGAEPKKGLLLDGSRLLTQEEFGKAFEMVITHKMPPADSGTVLNEIESGDVLIELFNLTKAKE